MSRYYLSPQQEAKAPGRTRAIAAIRFDLERQVGSCNPPTVRERVDARSGPPRARPSILLHRYPCFLDRSDERQPRILGSALAADHVGTDGQRPVQGRGFLDGPILDQRPGGCLGRIDDHPLFGFLKSDRDRLAPFSFRHRKLSDLRMLTACLIGRFISSGEAVSSGIDTHWNVSGAVG